MWPQRVFSTWWLTLSLKKAVIQVLYLLVKFATLLQRPCWHFWAWSTFFSDNLPNCVQLCLRSRMYWISFFTGPGSAIFLGHPSTNSVWSSAVIQQPQNRRQRFSWERPKRSKMSHQMSPKVPGEAGGKLRVAVWAFPESSSSRGAHSAVGHCHALKWLGWSPGITVGCRPPHPVRRHCQQRRREGNKVKQEVTAGLTKKYRLKRQIEERQERRKSETR